MKVRMIFARDHEGKRYACDTTPEVDDALAASWIERGIAEPAEPVAAPPAPAPKKAKA